MRISWKNPIRPLIAIALICGAVYTLAYVDIYAYFDAKLPLSTESAEEGVLALKGLSWNGVDPRFEDMVIKKFSRITLTGDCDLDWQEWRVGPSVISIDQYPLKDSKALKFRQQLPPSGSRGLFDLALRKDVKAVKEREKPSPSVRVDIVRRSWLSPGEAVVSCQFASVQKSGDDTGSWFMELPALERARE